MVLKLFPSALLLQPMAPQPAAPLMSEKEKLVVHVVMEGEDGASSPAKCCPTIPSRCWCAATEGGAGQYSTPST